MKKEVRRISALLLSCAVLASLGCESSTPAPAETESAPKVTETAAAEAGTEAETEPAADADPHLSDPNYMKGHDTPIVCASSSDEVLYVLNSGAEKEYKSMSLKPTEDQTLNGAALSGRWEHQEKKTVVSVRKPPKDVTGYTDVCLWVYSEKATGSQMQFCIVCQPAETAGKTAYRRSPIVVDWEGWKLIDLPLGEFVDGYNADFTKVSAININATGWDMTPDPETVLYFDSIYFCSNDYSCSLSDEEIGDYNYDHFMDALCALQNGGGDDKKAVGEYRERMEYYSRQADEAQSAMERGDNVPFSANMDETAGITTNYRQILSMARGYGMKGSYLYHNKSLLDDILYALEYMHTNYYSDQKLHEYPILNNWWDWQIGAAQYLVSTLMLIRDSVDQSVIDRYLEPVNRYDPLPSMTMANRVDIAYVTMAAAALQHDAVRLARSRDMLTVCCDYVYRGDGFYRDGSFVQHDHLAYTGCYGPIMLEALSRLIYAAEDTCFRFDEKVMNCQKDWALESFTPLMVHGAFFGNVRGRSISRTSTDVSIGLTAVQGMLRLSEYLPDQAEADKLRSIIKEYASYNDEYYAPRLDPVDLAIYDKIKADSSIKARENYTLGKVFAGMDRPVVHRPGYSASVSLSSSRIGKFEAFNGENYDGWYTGDGMLYVYLTTDDYNPDFWHNVDHYRLPGTTVTDAERVGQYTSSGDTLTEADFVGGVSLDDCVVSAMDLRAAYKHFDSPLTAKKGWFFFADEIVCLGADIDNPGEYNTLTVIENRRTDKLTADGAVVSDASGVLDGAASLYMEGLGGIYLPEKTVIEYKQSDFCELVISHGANIADASYEYVILPGTDESTSAAYAVQPDIEILSDTASVMAVRDTSTGMTGYIFWEAGNFDGVTVSAPCTVLVTDGRIAASDPTQKLKAADITLDGKTYHFDFDGLPAGSSVSLER
ncbi:MAG: polysaccharide lyase 8 family protein [Clostridia bacterium]|nr:polysaccharide lyase 8 family protein [Clostridia bacterium]